MDLSAVIAIVLIDLALSGDNALLIGMAARRLPDAQRRRAIVLGVGGAAHGDLPLLAFGLVVSIPIVLFGSGIIARVLDRAPRLIWLGALALVWTAGDMILGDPAIDPHVADHWAISAGVALAILGVVVGVRALRHHAA